jgi:hypothetical protein
MKFFKVITPHSQTEIDEIIMSMSQSEVEYILKLYAQVSVVEFTDESGYECMYAILDHHLINKLDELYAKYGIKSYYEDLTKEIIFDNKIPMKFKNSKSKSVKKEILDLIQEFKLNWVSKDDILDKILEKGISSLTKLDFEILNH